VLFELLQGVLGDVVGFGAAWCVVVGCHRAFPFVPVVAIAGVRPDVLRAAVLGLNARRPRLVPDLDVPGRSGRNVWRLFGYGPTAPAPSETPGELRMETRPFGTSESE